MLVVKLVMKEVIRFAIFAKRFVDVVVARVVVPLTIKLPVLVEFVLLLRKAVFSTQLVPSHLRVASVTVPDARDPLPLPATLIHLVDVPVLERT